MQINRVLFISALFMSVMMALPPSSAATFVSSSIVKVAAVQAEEGSKSSPRTSSLQQRVERDPTRPPVDVVDLAENGDRSRVRTANLKLEFIRHSSRGSSSAVINNETYIIGDRIGGWAVKEIQADRVILIRGNEEIVLSVFSGLTRSSLRDNQ